MPDPASSPSDSLGGTKPEPDRIEAEDIIALSTPDFPDFPSIEDFLYDSKRFGLEAEQSNSGITMPDDLKLPPSSPPQAAVYYKDAEV